VRLGQQKTSQVGKLEIKYFSKEVYSQQWTIDWICERYHDCVTCLLGRPHLSSLAHRAIQQRVFFLKRSKRKEIKLKHNLWPNEMWKVDLPLFEIGHGKCWYVDALHSEMAQGWRTMFSGQDFQRQFALSRNCSLGTNIVKGTSSSVICRLIIWWSFQAHHFD